MKLRGVNERIRVIRAIPKTNLVTQSDRDLVDINTIVAKYRATREWNHVNPKEPVYGNWDPHLSLTEAFQAVQVATERFAMFDPEIRRAAGNDPVRLLEMLETPEGRERLEQAGLRFGEDLEPPLALGSQDVSESVTTEEEPTDEKAE